MADEKTVVEKVVAADKTTEQAEQEEEEEMDFNKLYEEAKAEYAQLMDKFLGADPPIVKLVGYPSCMWYPGIEADMEVDGLKFGEEVKRS
ncbi:hypothetical protein D1007_02446 [Hordeum vulgare]|nr:hypothetical protein D1007_02446 [Hordeum vulgare]